MMKTGTLAIPGTADSVSVAWLEKRELRLLRLIVEGKSPKQIAALLFISAGTARGQIADLGRGIGEAHLPPRPPLSPAELQRWALQTSGALRPGPVVMQEHPPNCPCSSAYCAAVFVARQ